MIRKSQGDSLNVRGNSRNLWLRRYFQIVTWGGLTKSGVLVTISAPFRRSVAQMGIPEVIWTVQIRN